MRRADTRLTRRHAAMHLGATMIPTSTAVAQNQRFRLLLNTSYSGPVSFFLLAQERGYLRDAGIDLALSQGGGAKTCAPHS